MGVVDPAFDLGEVVVAELVTCGGGIAVPGLEQADHILGRMLPPVGALGVVAFWRNPLQVLIQRAVSIERRFQVARQNMEQQAVVSGALHIGFTSHGVDAAAGDSDIAQ